MILAQSFVPAIPGDCFTFFAAHFTHPHRLQFITIGNPVHVVEVGVFKLEGGVKVVTKVSELFFDLCRGVVGVNRKEFLVTRFNQVTPSFTTFHL